jgi:hypothetical protein
MPRGLIRVSSLPSRLDMCPELQAKLQTWIQNHGSPCVGLSRPHSHASLTRWPFDAHSDEQEGREARRGSMCGGDRAPSAPVLAAVEADARCIAKRQHAALHDAERDTRCAGSLTAREVAHAERRWRRHGGKTHPRRGSAAAHGGEGTLLAAGPREARSYLKQGQQQLNVFSGGGRTASP